MEKDIPFKSVLDNKEGKNTQEEKPKRSKATDSEEDGEEGEEGGFYRKDPKEILLRTLNKINDKYTKVNHLGGFIQE